MHKNFTEFKRVWYNTLRKRNSQQNIIPFTLLSVDEKFPGGILGSASENRILGQEKAHREWFL